MTDEVGCKLLKDIEIKNLHRRISSNSESTLLETLIEAKVEISHSCGGMGTCGTCRVIVHQGANLEIDRNEVEAEIANDRGLRENERLSCQIPAVPGLVIEIPEE